MQENIDSKTVSGFGDEWSRFDQTKLSVSELSSRFEEYFSIFPWHALPNDACGFDLGCGSGRWAKEVVEKDKVGFLHCIDPSKNALDVAKRNLADTKIISFKNESVDNLSLVDDSMDFGYSLGVLHHVPDTQAGMVSCVKKLKKGAPFLVYLYYAFDNRPWWFRKVWQVSNIMRRMICLLPMAARNLVCQMLAIIIYWPLARAAGLWEKLGFSVQHWPLSYYRNYSFYSMRTDALDRFGTRLEHRYSQQAIRKMMEEAGLEKITFSEKAPYWCAVGLKK